MVYVKPEVSKLASPNKAIQGTSGKCGIYLETVPGPFYLMYPEATVAAHEADE